MNRAAHRIAALALIPGLVFDPCLSQVSFTPRSPVPAQADHVFEQQAFNPVSIWTGISSISRKLPGRTRRWLDGLLPLPVYVDGLPGYERVERSDSPQEPPFSW